MGEALIPIETRTDEELVSLVLTGEAEVFAHVYERYYSRTYRLAYGMTGRHDAAEDLTQEVFIRAYQKLSLFAGESSFATWFYRLAFNTIGELNLPRFKIRESAVLLRNGKVLIAGGGWGVEVYDPSTSRFSAWPGGITVGRYYSTATLLNDGRVLIAGGFGSSRENLFDYANARAWIYEPE